MGNTLPWWQSRIIIRTGASFASILAGMAGYELDTHLATDVALGLGVLVTNALVWYDGAKFTALFRRKPGVANAV